MAREWKNELNFKLIWGRIAEKLHILSSHKLQTAVTLADLQKVVDIVDLKNCLKKNAVCRCQEFYNWLVWVIYFQQEIFYHVKKCFIRCSIMVLWSSSGKDIGTLPFLIYSNDILKSIKTFQNREFYVENRY